MPTRTERHATLTIRGEDGPHGRSTMRATTHGIFHGLVEGGTHTVNRAELTAVNHAVQVANQPTHIVSDCLSVVNTARAIFYGSQSKEVGGDHADW